MNLPEGVTEFGRERVVPGGDFFWWELAAKPRPEDRERFGVYVDVPEELRHNGRRLVSKLLQPLRDRLGPITITPRGGYRPDLFNQHVGGAKLSQHRLCTASDIKSKKFSPESMRRSVLKLWTTGVIELGGVGLYKSFLHVDVRVLAPGELPKQWGVKAAGGAD